MARLLQLVQKKNPRITAAGTEVWILALAVVMNIFLLRNSHIDLAQVTRLLFTIYVLLEACFSEWVAILMTNRLLLIWLLIFLGLYCFLLLSSLVLIVVLPVWVFILAFISATIFHWYVLRQWSDPLCSPGYASSTISMLLSGLGCWYMKRCQWY